MKQKRTDGSIYVLIVEDDREDFELAEDLLMSTEGQKYAVSWCGSYDRALEQLRIFDYDVALVDYQIGARTGLEFISQVGPLHPNCPMILLTGMRSPEIDLAAQSAGAADYLVKDSLNPELLDRSIRYARQHVQRWSLLNTVLHNAASGMVALDPNCKPIVWNPQALVALGLSEADDGEVSDNILAALLEICKDGVLPLEVSAPNGEMFELSINQVPGGGQILAFQNVTRRAKAEELLRRAVADAEAANLAKSSFLATMSHELRTPLNGILGMVRVLENMVSDESQRDCVDSIASSGRLLLAIINDLLDLSKIEAGHMELEEIEFELVPAVRDVVKLLAADSDAKGLEIIANIGALAPKKIKGDPLRIKQVLTNLVGNAIKFTSTGFVKIEVDARCLDAEWSLRFSVSDSGIGIAEDTIGKLFQRFVQADNTTTRKFGGTGLGLALCKEFVSLMGGQISCRSELGRGSTFSFEIPGGPLDPAYSSLVQRKVHALAGDGVLVVTRSEALSAATRSYLESLGADCDVAGTDEEAVHLLAARSFAHIVYDARHGTRPCRDLIAASSGRPAAERPRLWVLAAESRLELANGDLHFEILETPFLTPTLDRLAVASTPRIQGARSCTPAASTAAPRSLRILMAEDDIPNQRVAAAIIKSHGFMMEIVNDGMEACRRVETAAFDVILMDVHMPNMDGLEATRKIRAMRNGRNVPIIGLTANVSTENRKRCHDVGMNQHISKPVDWDRLIALLEALEDVPEAVPA